MSNANITQDTSAQIAVITNGLVQSGNVIEYHAGTEVELMLGFEVELGAVFMPLSSLVIKNLVDIFSLL